jgi:endoglucanase
MNNTFVVYDVLKRLTDAAGVAGNEQAAAEVALELLWEYAPDADFDRHGSVVGIVGGDSVGKDKPTILLDAHIDQIGLIVTHIDDAGFVKAEPVGGVDRRGLAGQNVTIRANGGKSAIRGTVCTLPPHVTSGKQADKAIKADSIWIDICGADKSEISLGDVITLDGELAPLGFGNSKTVSGAALDDRAGVCAILYALHLLKRNRSELPWRVAVSFSVQEEVGCRGASVTAFNLEPDYAIAVDVSYGMSPGCSSEAHKCGTLGKGPMIGYAPSLNRPMFEMLKNAAIDGNIPHQIEIMNRDTGGTNADTISLVKGGVKTALISIPLRYMHTVVETADLGDIEAAGKLIAAFLTSGECPQSEGSEPDNGDVGGVRDAVFT